MKIPTAILTVALLKIVVIESFTCMSQYTVRYCSAIRRKTCNLRGKSLHFPFLYEIERAIINVRKQHAISTKTI